MRSRLEICLVKVDEMLGGRRTHSPPRGTGTRTGEDEPAEAGLDDISVGDVLTAAEELLQGEAGDDGFPAKEGG
ncbi:unnamed protein product [Linum trigynum]|uniref:Uncharacterized protein n=1 Tax=Linum trigynum TaxID=586398 RepID=A0AAV2FTY8_9ROSI